MRPSPNYSGHLLFRFHELGSQYYWNRFPEMTYNVSSETSSPIIHQRTCAKYTKHDFVQHVMSSDAAAAAADVRSIQLDSAPDMRFCLSFPVATRCCSRQGRWPPKVGDPIEIKHTQNSLTTAGYRRLRKRPRSDHADRISTFFESEKPILQCQNANILWPYTTFTHARESQPTKINPQHTETIKII